MMKIHYLVIVAFLVAITILLPKIKNTPYEQGMINATYECDAEYIEDGIRDGQNVNLITSQGRTLLMNAIANDCTRIAEMLILATADLSAVDANGHDALWYAKVKKNEEIIELIDWTQSKMESN
jgi:ankyrin repeat protein